MKRAEFVERDCNGQPLRDAKGWSGEIDGVPVVICRVGTSRGWHVYEPTCGREICGAWGSKREDALASVAERVGKVAESKGIGAGAFLRSLIPSPE